MLIDVTRQARVLKIQLDQPGEGDLALLDLSVQAVRQYPLLGGGY